MNRTNNTAVLKEWDREWAIWQLLFFSGSTLKASWLNSDYFLYINLSKHTILVWMVDKLNSRIFIHPSYIPNTHTHSQEAWRTNKAASFHYGFNLYLSIQVYFYYSWGRWSVKGLVPPHQETYTVHSCKCLWKCVYQYETTKKQVLSNK